MSAGAITTEAELAALPEKTAVVDRMGDVGTVLAGMLRYPETTPQSFDRAAKKYGPFHIVYSPPLPEPQPEWEPGTVYAAVQKRPGPDRVECYWSTYSSEDGVVLVNDVGSEFEPHELDDVRPLVVIDPAAVDVDALVETYQGAYTDTGGYGYDGHRRRAIAMRAALSHLGIEATS